jgi:hypothetical protein
MASEVINRFITEIYQSRGMSNTIMKYLLSKKKFLQFFKVKNDNIPWQPRLEHWFNVNRARNQLVEPYNR